MRRFMASASVVMIAAALAGCGSDEAGSKQPSGQVVATIGNDEITLRELNAELQGVRLPTAEALKAAEREALEVIINRKILANAAREQGLDDTAEFQLRERRTREVLLAEALQQQFASKVARPTREEAEQYIASHPNIFEQRKFYVLDQIQFARPANVHDLQAFKPLKTMDEVEQKLLSQGIEYRRLPASVDAVGTNPQMVTAIAELPQNEVFLVPSGNLIMVNQVKEARVIPFTGEPAIAYAQQLLYNEKAGKTLMKQLEGVRKAAGEVTYKKGYGKPANAPAKAASSGSSKEKAPNASENITPP